MGILGMVTPLNITSAEQFNQFVQVVGADRYVTITPWTEGSDTFVNFKGNIFFKPELRQWPFDRQELVIQLVPTVPVSGTSSKIRFCVMRNYTTVAPTVRLAGVSSEGPWEDSRLMLQYSLNHTCGPPFTNPTGEGCDKLENHDDNDVSCWCMGGKRKRHVAKFSILFTRPTSRMLVNIFLPPIAIMFLNHAVLLLYVEASETRLSMCSSALLSSVMYHTTINYNIPSTATESTKADCLMMLCYGQNVLIWIVVLIQYIASNSSQYGQVGRWARSSLFTKSRIVLPLNSALLILLVFKTDSRGLLLGYVFNIVALFVGAMVDFAQFTAWERVQGSARATHRGSRVSERASVIELVEPEQDLGERG